MAAYQQYVRHELTAGSPARVQHVFERAVLDNCLSAELWQAYTRYLDLELRPAAELTLAVHERAVSNLPWAAPLWEAYIRAAERAGTPLAEVEGQLLPQPHPPGGQNWTDGRALSAAA